MFSSANLGGMNAIHPVRKAVDIVGSATELAKRLGVTPPSIHQWISGFRRVPAERCPLIERATGGAVRCEELRPDVDWAVLRGTAAATAARDSGATGTLADGEAA